MPDKTFSLGKIAQVSNRVQYMQKAIVQKEQVDTEELKKSNSEDREMAEMLDNPLTALYNQQHPDVVESAKKWQYGN